MLLSFILALLVSQLYRRTHTGMGWEPSFLATLVLLAPVVALVMLFIQGDLVLSLGLVGSLSIIRFRTPIKDARDMVFLFWVIAIGLGTGTLYWTLTAAATALLAVLTLLLYRLYTGDTPRAHYVLVASGGHPMNPEAMEDVLHRFCSSINLRSHEMQDERWEAVFELRLADDTDSSTLLGQLRSLEAVDRVSILAPELSLPA